MIKVAIIEDEILAQQELKQLLSQTVPTCEVVACLRSVSQSITWMSEHVTTIDLIFADIELLDGQCFQIFEKVQLDIPVIFLTAYDEYAIDAFKVNSIDYLLKPLEQEALQKALHKHDRLTKGRSNSAILNQLASLIRPAYKKRVSIKIGDTYQYLSVKTIAYFLARDKATYLVTFDEKRYLVDKPLNELEEQLDPTVFFRATRNYLLNIEAVVRADKYFHSRLKVSLQPASIEEVLISRVRVSEFLRWMDMG